MWTMSAHHSGLFVYTDSRPNRFPLTKRPVREYFDCTLVCDIVYHEALARSGRRYGAAPHFHVDAQCRAGVSLTLICESPQRMMGWINDELVLDIPYDARERVE